MYSDYGLPQESSANEFVDALKRFGWPKMLLLLLVISTLGWFLFQAQPGKLTVTVVELDSGKFLPSAQLSVFDSEGKLVGKPSFSDETGQAVLTNLPAGKSLRLKADVSSSFKPSSREFSLKSGEARVISLEIARKTDVEISLPQNSLSLAPGCSRNLTVSLKNLGEPAEVELIGDGALKNLVYSPQLRLPKGLVSSMVVKISSPSEQGQGGDGFIRIKKSDVKTPLSISVVRPSTLELTPSTIYSEVMPGEEFRQLITVTNQGEEEEIVDLTATPSGGIAQFSEVSIADSSPLKPKEKNILTLVSRIPPFATGKLVGWVTVATPCRNYLVNVELQVRTN